MALDPTKFRFQQRTSDAEYPSGWRTRPFHQAPELVLGLLEDVGKGDLEDLRDDVNAEIARRNEKDG